MQILVVDARSQDATAAIARERGARVVVRPWEGFRKGREFALTHVLTPWTLMLDADEALDSELRGAIESADSAAADGYYLSRTTYYCGKPLRMWSGERLLRLFKTDRAALHTAPAGGGDADLHEFWTCSGSTGALPGTLLHFSYSTHDAYRKKFARYTSIEAAGVRASFTGALRQAILVPARFARYAFARGAALDGIAGLRVAWFSALYPAVVQWKALRRFDSTPPFDSSGPFDTSG
jgi:glycosyltransferase involved in cell wall biosynthesis